MDFYSLIGTVIAGAVTSVALWLLIRYLSPRSYRSTPTQVLAVNPVPMSRESPAIPLIPKPPVVGFVARKDTEGNDIVEFLKKELSPGQNQLIALWGGGGVGKTTLAAEVARALSEVYEKRIIWISTDKRADFNFSAFLDEIAIQLNHTQALKYAIEPKEAEIEALIAAAPVFIILDNFEIIAPDEQKRCIEFLTRRSSYPALITTRQRVEDARNIPINAMSLAEANEFLERLIKQASDPDVFAKSERDLIIKVADGNPLVMQWVVAQIELAQQPDHVLNELMQGEGDAAERIFDRSFSLPQLGEDGRNALLALSLFVPSATRDALAEVAGFDGDVRRLNEAVRNLRALSLIKAVDENRRFTLEALTRSLAHARLSKDERGVEFRQRFVAYFLNYAQAHARPTPEDFDALEAEKDNVLGAMDLAFAMQDWNDAMQIRIALDIFLDLHGYWDEAIRSGERALEAARNLAMEERIASFALKLAVIYQRRGEIEEARELYSESLEFSKKLGDRSLIASTLHQLAILAQDQGEIEEARRLYNESLEIDKKFGNQSGIASTLHQLGRLAQNQGEIEEALRLYDESLEIAKKLGDQSNIAVTLHELGGLAQAQGETEEARRLYNESLEIKKKLGNQSGIAITLGQLGLLAEKEGNIEEAVRLLREALVIFEKLKSPYAEMVRLELEKLETRSSS